MLIFLSSFRVAIYSSQGQHNHPLRLPLRCPEHVTVRRHLQMNWSHRPGPAQTYPCGVLCIFFFTRENKAIMWVFSQSQAFSLSSIWQKVRFLIWNREPFFFFFLPFSLWPTSIYVLVEFMANAAFQTAQSPLLLTSSFSPCYYNNSDSEFCKDRV